MIRNVACALLVLLALPLCASGGRAAELVMFDDPGCSWCRLWHAEIGPGYPHTPEGKQAPLRRVHIRDQATAGVELASPVRGTPTFVLADNGREVGRIVGYPGSDFFYPRLAELLQRLPEPARAPAERSTRAAPDVQDAYARQASISGR